MAPRTSSDHGANKLTVGPCLDRESDATQPPFDITPSRLRVGSLVIPVDIRSTGFSSLDALLLNLSIGLGTEIYRSNAPVPYTDYFIIGIPVIKMPVFARDWTFCA